MSSKVSIIVPVYNSKKYLKNAIDCLINQTLKDIEIILVDDGSTDGSSKICDDIASEDSRVIVKHLENNKGLCNARNVGIKCASSKYITFMDNDDEVDKTTCEENYNLMEKYNLDMIKFGRKGIVLNNGKIEKEGIRSFEDKILEKEDLQKEKINLFYDDVFNCIWDGFFRKDIMVEFDTSLKMGGEDYLFGLEIYPKLNKIMLRSKVYYYHFIRRGVSTSTKYNDNLVEDELKILNKYQELFVEDEDVNAGKYNMKLYKDFVSPIIMNFSKTECKLSKKQKIQEMKKIHSNIKLKKVNLIEMVKLSLKYTISFVLFRLRMYSILLLIYKIRG